MTKLFFAILILYAVLQAGRYWGHTEIRTYDTQANTYNRILLQNCLKHVKSN